MDLGAVSASSRPTTRSVSVIVCTLNEERNVAYVLNRMPPWLNELIVVDGRSQDRTIDVVKATAPDAQVFVQNGRGKGDALRCGIAVSTGDIVITMDADGSHDPAEIPRYLTKIHEGRDLVKGSRFLPGGGTKDMPVHRVIANRFLTWLSNILVGTRLTDISYGFSAFRGEILRQMPTTRHGFEMETELIMRFQLSGLSVAEVPSFESARLFGTGKLQSIRDGYRIMATILAFGLRRLTGRSFHRAQIGHRRLPYPRHPTDITEMSPRLASIVVSTYAESRLHYAIRAIASAHEQTYQEREVILVVDDEGGLARAAPAQVAPPTRVLINPHPGMAQARNFGLQHAHGGVVVFLDDDAIAEPDWLERLMAHYVDDRVAGVGGRSVPAWEGPAAEWFPPELYWVLGCTYRGHPDRVGEVRNIIGNSMSYRTSVVRALGGFTLGRGRYWQITSGTAEETELCLRLRRRFPQARIVYEPSAVVHHIVPRARLRLGYICLRAVGEGVAKARIQHLHGVRSGVLAHEHDYLRFLLWKAIPQTLMREGPRRPRVAIARAGMILLVVAATGLGYGWTRIKEYRQGVPPPLTPAPGGAPEEFYTTNAALGPSDNDPWRA